MAAVRVAAAPEEGGRDENRLGRRLHPHHFFSREEKHRIAGAIHEAEGRTAGEIASTWKASAGGDPVRPGAASSSRPWAWPQTAARNGVLIYLAVRERTFAIIGDEGIDRVVPPGFWEETKDVMAGYFREGKFARASIHGIQSAGAHLAAYFPRAADDVNELTDEISEGK